MALYSDKESSPCQDDVSSIFDWGDIHYLQGTSVTLDCSPIDTESPDRVPGSVPRYLKIYGAPYVPECGPDHENAVQYPVTHNAWNRKIPHSTDILVTHTPPKYYLDWDSGSPEGCAFLLDEVRKVRPLLHVFGHVHASYGAERVIWNKAQLRWEDLLRRGSEVAEARWCEDSSTSKAGAGCDDGFVVWNLGFTGEFTCHGASRRTVNFDGECGVYERGWEVGE